MRKILYICDTFTRFFLQMKCGSNQRFVFLAVTTYKT